MTPTPQGDITNSGLWQGQEEENQPVEETKDEPAEQVRPDEVQKD